MTTIRKQSKNGGFTIVESLVAVTVLILAIAGASSAISQGISSYTFSKDQIIAFYLAQEGFEQIRNIRDENGLKDQDWLTGVAANASDPCYFGKACIVDPVVSSAPTECTAIGSCPALRKDSATGFYGYNGAWSQTQFTREITLTQVAANEVSILVTVSWSKGLVDREFRARGNILDWQQ